MTLRSDSEGTLRDGLYIKAVPSYYSPEQVAQYLTRVGYTPVEHTDEQLLANNNFPTTLENIERLIRLHVLTFPFENTAMHYDPSYMVDMDPQILFHRFIIEEKGSYCLGHNSLFLGILRGLGYRAYHVAARVNDDRVLAPAEFASLTHLLILVQPHPDSNVTYFVDAGPGIGPLCPMLLSDSDKNIVIGTTPTEKFRLKRRTDPRSSLESRNGYAISGQNWAVEVQYIKDPTADPSMIGWIPLYMFSEEESYANDIHDASFVASCGSIDRGRFKQNIIILKYAFLDDNGDLVFDTDKIGTMKADGLKHNLGRVILFGRELTYQRGPNSEVVRSLRTERERIGVLKELFGIVIREEEMRYIEGKPSALDFTGDD
ncbi:hypothetical protein AX15_002994 [Amanita polypyramis BW_CC]|nr:hypothetical protein AX15_002994 [Amanita polypyramis BW_CC]